MKKYIVALFVTLLTIAACSKELEGDYPNDDNVNNEDITILTFSSERPSLDMSTKTAWDEDTHGIVWSANDKIKIGFTFNGDWWGQSAAYTGSGHIKFYQSDGVTIDPERQNIGTFTVPVGSNFFSGPTTTGDFVFYAAYPSSLIDNNQDNAPNVPITLNSYQFPLENSFDPASDILVAKSKTITPDKPGLPSEIVNLYWTRVVAHGNFTLKDFQGVEEGETISKVVFTAQEGANLTGKQVISVVDGSFSGNTTSNVVTLDGTNLSFVTDENNKTNLNVWFSVMPVTLTALDVVVETDKATYHRSFTGIERTLVGNRRNTMGINMASAEKTPKVQYYWVRRDISAITSDDVFVIVGKLNSGATYAIANDKGTDSAPDAVAVSVTASGDRLTSVPAERIQWTLSKRTTGFWIFTTTYYTFYPNGTTNRWLYCNNSNNGVRVGTNNNDEFTISGGYLCHSSTGRYVGIYNAQDWRSYQNTNSFSNQSFAFYVRVNAEDPVLPTPTISFTPSSITINAGESISNPVSIDPSGLPVTYSSSDPNIAYVDPSTGEVTGVARGYATITALFLGNASYNAVSTTCNVVVADPSRPYTITFVKNITFTGGVGSYTSSFVNTCAGVSLTLANVNNGGTNDNWTVMRAGRSGAVSVATITTNSAIPEAVKSVTLSITQINTTYVNSIKLIVSPTSDFSSTTEYDFHGTVPGDVSAIITNPAANMYYRIAIDLQAATQNGFFRFNKIVYSAE